MDYLLQLFVACLVVGPSLSADWSFKTQEEWGETYPDCNKNSQSPIDIVTKDAEIDYTLPIIDRKIFDAPPTKMTVGNTGYGLLMTFDKGAYEVDDEQLLPFKAKMMQYHFHWGKSATSPGAEHTINGKQYFAELHAVHYNTKYDNISQAVDKPDGLAVFGWLIDVDYPQNDQAYQLLLSIAKAGAPNTNNETDVTELFSLETLLPTDLTKYYRYKGSLTTPGCFESVTWTVFEEPIRISKEQAEVFVNIFKDADGLPIQDTFRVPQPLNGRKVTKPPPLVAKSKAESSANTSMGDEGGKSTEAPALTTTSGAVTLTTTSGAVTMPRFTAPTLVSVLLVGVLCDLR